MFTFQAGIHARMIAIYHTTVMSKNLFPFPVYPEKTTVKSLAEQPPGQHPPVITKAQKTSQS